MRTLLLMLFTLLAGSAAAQDSASSVNCKYDESDCRDGCTIDYGGSSRDYDKLGACLKKCKREYDRCLEHQFSIGQEKLKEQAKPMSADGGTQGADGGPTDKDGGTSKPSKLEDTSELDRMYDEQQPPPPPPKSKSKPKEEPQKKSTDDWAPTEK